MSVSRVCALLVLALQCVNAQDTDCESRWPQAYCITGPEHNCPAGWSFSYSYCGFQKICCIPESGATTEPPTYHPTYNYSTNPPTPTTQGATPTTQGATPTTQGATPTTQDETPTTQVPAQTCGRRLVRAPSDASSSRITGGTESYPGEWPWQVSVCYITKYFHSCGGTIIGRKWILTAAHCLYNKTTPSDWKVRTGKFDRWIIEGPERTYSVEKIFMHELYDDDAITYDIALLLLTSEIDFDDYTQPACLPYADEDFDNQICIGTGWGASYQAGPMSRTMEKVRLPVISNSLCDYYHKSYVIGPYNMCAYQPGGGRDTCRGDSGGPLNCMKDGAWKVAGVISWGLVCGDRDSPGVYTRVSEMLDWIDDKQRQYS